MLQLSNVALLDVLGNSAELAGRIIEWSAALSCAHNPEEVAGLLAVVIIDAMVPVGCRTIDWQRRLMSHVTVKIPGARAPFACMRRSGITSRSKCASFSISQRSCQAPTTSRSPGELPRPVPG